MKKFFSVLVSGLVIGAAGCVSEPEQEPQADTTGTEEIQIESKEGTPNLTELTMACTDSQAELAEDHCDANHSGPSGSCYTFCDVTGCSYNDSTGYVVYSYRTYQYCF